MPGDKFSVLRSKLDHLARHTNEWCGLPVPIKEQRLLVEDKHPASKLYLELGRQEHTDPATVVNSWYSHEKRGDVMIWREPDGSLGWGVAQDVHHFRYDLNTMFCSIAWSVESEEKAQEMLKGLIPLHLFKMYQLTGMFMETSRRSGMTYIFRRLRPTVVLAPDRQWSWKEGRALKRGLHPNELSTRILTTLCLHPIGYYADSWAGSMCPTDDVIAHLLLMRGDEVMLWRRANQIPAHRAQAGL